MPVRYANGPLLQVPEADRDEQVLMQVRRAATRRC